MASSTLPAAERDEFIAGLERRFAANMRRHESVEWSEVRSRLRRSPAKLWSLHEMERTGGEPDVVDLPDPDGSIVFVDCSTESPAGRRSLCFDDAALKARKANKPAGSAMGMAAGMGVELLTEEEYRRLQQFGEFDMRTSSWVQTPARIRKLGGALFCDRRFDTVFTYHNGVESYYASRGFRGSVRF